ncbi:MAG: methyltransferase domain-containing protein [Planctomycetes bacterium]|nr:methyltransferase domain-containing protein [Planctomycetota bacterium]
MASGVSTDRPSIRPGIRVAALPGETVAYDAAAGSVHRLNQTAGLILALCDGQRTRAEIAASLERLTGEAGAAAVAPWIDEAAQSGLIAFDQAEPASLVEMDAEDLCDAANVLWDQGEMTASLACQQRACELAPGDPGAWCSLGEMALVAGERAAAAAAYRRYLALAPDDAEVEHLLFALRGEPPPARASDQCVRLLYQRFAGFYEHNMREELGYAAPERLLEALAPFLPPAARSLAVLDLGCGTGFFGAAAREFARELVGVDLSPEMAEQAARRGVYDRIDVGELTAWLAGNAQRFDLAAACDVLIHFGDLEIPLRAAAAALAPGGLLGFTVERASCDGWLLTDSGRYAHGAPHVRAGAALAGLEVLVLKEAFLRLEYGEPVAGLIAVLQAARAG